MGSQAEGTACAEARGPRAFRPARGSPSPRCHRREGTEGGRVRPATPEVAGASWASRARRRPRLTPPRRLAQSHPQGRSAPGAGRRPLTRPERLLSPGLGRAPGRRLAARGQGCSSLPDRAELLSGVRSEVQHRRWKCSGRAHRTRPSDAPTPSSPAAQPRPPRGCSGLTPARSWGNRGAPRTHCGVSRSPGRWGAEARLPPSRVSRRVSPAGAEMTVRSGKSGFRRQRIEKPQVAPSSPNIPGHRQRSKRQAAGPPGDRGCGADGTPPGLRRNRPSRCGAGEPREPRACPRGFASGAWPVCMRARPSLGDLGSVCSGPSRVQTLLLLGFA